MHKSGNSYTAIRALKEYIIQTEKSVIENSYTLDQCWPILWGVLKAILNMDSEEEVSNFIGWLLNETKRQEYISNENERERMEEIFRAEHEMCLIVLEHRVRKRGISSEVFAEELKVLWSLGKNVFFLRKGIYSEKICLLCNEFMEKDASDIERVKNDLINDYSEGLRRTFIAGVVCE